MYTKLFSSAILFLGLALSISAQTSWNTPGDIQNNYLDFAHTQRTWSDIELTPGEYEWTLETQKNNGKTGKVNLDIHVKEGSRYDKKVDKKLLPGRTDRGRFFVTRQTTNASKGKVKVHIGRAAHNTNVNYEITLRKVGNLPANLDNSASACNYTNLGSKSGNVVGNTRGTKTADKVACKSTARVKVTKTGGRARTTILVYKSRSKNGQYSLVDSVEFPNGNGGGSKTVTVRNANGYWIKAEVKNRSAANTFKYNLTITQ